MDLNPPIEIEGPEKKKTLSIGETLKRAAVTGLIALIGGIGGSGTNYIAKQPSIEPAYAYANGVLLKEDYYKDRVADQERYFKVIQEIRDRLSKIEAKAEIEPKYKNN